MCAPLDGWLIPLSAVDDPVFSGRVLGDGFAIDPTATTLRAPFDGVITSIHRARHALTLRADDGAEILMHIGLDTVGLKGEGFTAHVAEGDRVSTGEPLIDFDMDVVSQLVRSLMVPIILTNGGAFSLSAVATDRVVAAGDALVDIHPVDGATATPAAPAAPAASDGAVERRTVTLTDPFGIHARPAGLLAAFAKSTQSAVTISFDGRRADPKSPTALMLLGAECGAVLTIEATGPDAAATATRIAAMLGTEAAETAPAPSAASTPSATPAPAAAVAASPPIAAGTALDLTGVTAAPGLAVGVSHRLILAIATVVEAGADPATEAAALAVAFDATRSAIAAEIAALGPSAGPQGEILGAHLAFLDDPDLRAASDALIAAGKSAGFAWKTAIETRVAALRALGKPILIERAADLLDVQRRVLLALSGDHDVAPDFAPDTVLFADDLLPSQFTALDLSRVVGIVLAGGGPTSHLAILAASRGIPAIVAVGPDALRIPDGEPCLLDADAGTLRIGAPAEAIEVTRRAATVRRDRAAADLAAAAGDCHMADGTRIEVFANLGGADDVAGALGNGAEGCGLLRSEFLFLDRATAPSEDEQLMRYQAVATGLQGRPLIVRTLDAGADKQVPYADPPKEENPALGMRGIRLSLARPELLRTQIRAILRIEPHGQARIMLPMIATLEDLRKVRRVVETESRALGRTTPIEVGIMVEVPSVALLAEVFAAEADFFSIGTNDLTQYTLAMDRGNAGLADRIDPLHPAVLRLVAMAAEGARIHGRVTGVCGALASLPLAAPVLIGLGVTELSATPAAIPALKARIRTLTLKRCTELAEAARRADSGDAVRRLLADAGLDA
ncbi:phosphoenolpyruvate--protein phosphotransferase [Siculibacillus lacustris]|uniref:phosphoenolpyruvate--protein phosphotransferase n=1 Tax=Siculibacillus lacustris TaxID=1549641 RepID=A0A4Q9VML3_9HYPH|nr:phosphoenolpyruvate--protein phosphotransferase [Siculibacillus lacustris]